MRLYLQRHGQSLSAAEAGVASDSDRPLSDQGRGEVRRVARRLAERGARPVIILHSPMIRAAQTAAEAAGILKPAQGLEAFAPLSNELPAEELAVELRRRTEGLPDVVAVGHQPQLGLLVAVLSQAVFNPRPGGAVALELKAEGPAAFLWACNPEDL